MSSEPDCIFTLPAVRKQKGSVIFSGYSTGMRIPSTRPSSFVKLVSIGAASRCPLSAPAAIKTSVSRPTRSLVSQRFLLSRIHHTTSFYPTVPSFTHPMSTFLVHAFFDKVTSTCTYLLADPASKEAIIIDSVLGFDPVTTTVDTVGADQILAFANDKGYKIRRILETHAHADHLTAAQYMKSRLSPDNVPVCIGSGITQVQETFKSIYALPSSFPTDGSQFDCLLGENDTFNIGTVPVRVLHTPGHTRDSISLLVGDKEQALFCGDLLFQPDVGTARCDFPGGSVCDLIKSIKRVYTLGDNVKVYVGHDYPPEGREPSWESTVALQRSGNKHAAESVDEEKFIEWRKSRDAALGAPRLLHYSLQVNIAAGHLPEKEGKSRFFKVPIKTSVEF